MLAHKRGLAPDRVRAAVQDQRHARRDGAFGRVNRADEELVPVIGGERGQVAAAGGEEDAVAGPGPHGLGRRPDVGDGLPVRVGLPARTAQDEQRHACFGRGQGSVRGDRAGERVGRVDYPGNPLSPQERGQSVDSAEPADAHRAVGQARLAYPAGQRGDHVGPGRHQRGGQFPGLAGPAKDEDAHRDRLTRQSRLAAFRPGMRAARVTAPAPVAVIHRGGHTTAGCVSATGTLRLIAVIRLRILDDHHARGADRTGRPRRRRRGGDAGDWADA